ncbi:uncharacterized protein LOC132261996 [Phlebotomus argentipes]|uniref:uncharacterized protein LOC132261996 n=1 Tax=Phlebotomus argentipes TaxID=94469 RepID=UPI002892EFA8|nr:uncharacterized protein LOC132261996 [Phlebotomus argentipes]
MFPVLHQNRAAQSEKTSFAEEIQFADIESQATNRSRSSSTETVVFQGFNRNTEVIQIDLDDSLDGSLDDQEAEEFLFRRQEKSFAHTQQVRWNERLNWVKSWAANSTHWNSQPDPIDRELMDDEYFDPRKSHKDMQHFMQGSQEYPKQIPDATGNLPQKPMAGQQQPLPVVNPTINTQPGQLRMNQRIQHVPEVHPAQTMPQGMPLWKHGPFSPLWTQSLRPQHSCLPQRPNVPFTPAPQTLPLSFHGNAEARPRTLAPSHHPSVLFVPTLEAHQNMGQFPTPANAQQVTTMPMYRDSVIQPSQQIHPGVLQLRNVINVPEITQKLTTSAIKPKQQDQQSQANLKMQEGSSVPKLPKFMSLAQMAEMLPRKAQRKIQSTAASAYYVPLRDTIGGTSVTLNPALPAQQQTQNLPIAAAPSNLGLKVSNTPLNVTTRPQNVQAFPVISSMRNSSAIPEEIIPHQPDPTTPFEMTAESMNLYTTIINNKHPDTQIAYETVVSSKYADLEVNSPHTQNQFCVQFIETTHTNHNLLAQPSGSNSLQVSQGSTIVTEKQQEDSHSSPIPINVLRKMRRTMKFCLTCQEYCYFVCSDCLSAVYCSLECAEKDPDPHACDPSQLILFDEYL